MVHNLDPFVIQFTETFGVRWYGLAYLLGFMFAYFFVSWLSRRQRTGMNSEMVADFVTYVAMGTLIGGRLGYVLFYSPETFISFKSEFPFWGVLAVNEGGMASHGGMIGMVISCYIYSLKYGINKWYLYDLICITSPVGVFLGRIANFINGELVGRTCAPDFPLAVKFPSDILNWPSSQFSKLTDLSVVVEKIGMTKDQWLEMLGKYNFDVGVRDQVFSTLHKIITQIQSGNTAAQEAIAPFLEPRHPSQLYAAAGEGVFIFLALLILWYKPRRPGMVGTTFLFLYGIVRIVDEHFRMPDAHIGYQLFDLTRGQWLSVGMIVVGLMIMFFINRSNSLPTAGWGLGQNVKIHRR